MVLKPGGEDRAALGAGMAPDMNRTFQAFRDDLDELHDTPFLARPEPWLAGTRTPDLR